jgi:AraC family transcriptional regulator
MHVASFLGSAERELHTPSFEFADRIALVPDREVPEHTHDNAHFICVVRGTYVTEARNEPGLCGAGSVIFNPAGTTHRDRFRTDRGRFFAISLASDLAESFGGMHPALLASQEVAALVRQARNEFEQATAFTELILEGLGLQLAGSVARWFAHPDAAAPRWLAEARDSIHDRCTAKLTIRQLAAEARVHPIHLARAFRQYFGCSPGEYLRRCRIERVRQLLATSEMPLAEVALEAGFADQSQLSTAFRRATGTTPRAFRRDVARTQIRSATTRRG